MLEGGAGACNHVMLVLVRGRPHAVPPAPPPCDIPLGCCSFTGPWTVTRSALRMLRRVAAFCGPLRPVLPLVSFPRSRSPVVGVPGLCWMWRDVPFARQWRPVVGVLGVVLVVAGVRPHPNNNIAVNVCVRARAPSCAVLQLCHLHHSIACPWLVSHITDACPRLHLANWPQLIS